MEHILSVERQVQAKVSRMRCIDQVKPINEIADRHIQEITKICEETGLCGELKLLRTLTKVQQALL